MLANAPSVSQVKPSLLAFLKFVNVWRGRSGMLVEKTPPIRIMIGRWSEFKVLMGVQSKSRVRWAVAKEMSGDDGEPFVGSRVGESVLRMEKVLFVEMSWM